MPEPTGSQPPNNPPSSPAPPTPGPSTQPSSEPASQFAWTTTSNPDQSSTTISSEQTQPFPVKYIFIWTIFLAIFFAIALIVFKFIAPQT